MKSGAKKLTSKILLVAFFYSSFAHQSQADEVNLYNSSISVQFGLNGSAGNKDSYGLAFLPPDISYSRELFDNDFWNISAGAFYDNIGVKVANKDQSTNFSYRVGTRIDFGIELGKYTPYITTGLGTIRNSQHYQTSPVYGTGFLIRLSKHLLMINELNFQKVAFNQEGYTIVNLSTGITYGF